MITLIDALYEHKVLVMVLADAPIMDLFSADRVPAPLSAAKSPPSVVQAAGSIVEKVDKVDPTVPQGSTSENSTASSATAARLQHDEVSVIVCISFLTAVLIVIMIALPAGLCLRPHCVPAAGDASTRICKGITSLLSTGRQLDQAHIGHHCRCLWRAEATRPAAGRGNWAGKHSREPAASGVEAVPRRQHRRK